jgi:hypothetical protein
MNGIQTRFVSHSESAPAAHRSWVQEDAAVLEALQRQLARWIENVAANVELFEKNVYGNPEANDSDFRQHRFLLYRMLADGEEIALGFLDVHDHPDSQSCVKLIDQKLGELSQVLFSWHGPLEAQSDIPESFKQGMKDLAAGHLIPMERALTENP